MKHLLVRWCWARKKPPAHVDPFNENWDVKAARQYWTGRICAALAGALAEMLYSRCWEQQSDTDEFAAWEIADCFYRPAKAARWINRLRFQTLETLRTPDVWVAVDAVAVELVKCKTLNSSRVHFLVEQVYGPVEREPKQGIRRKWFISDRQASTGGSSSRGTGTPSARARSKRTSA